MTGGDVDCAASKLRRLHYCLNHDRTPDPSALAISIDDDPVEARVGIDLPYPECAHNDRIGIHDRICCGQLVEKGAILLSLSGCEVGGTICIEQRQASSAIRTFVTPKLEFHFLLASLRDTYQFGRSARRDIPPGISAKWLATRAATEVACVSARSWAPPLTTSRVALGINSCSLWPTGTGLMRSSLPHNRSVGISIEGKTSERSSCSSPIHRGAWGYALKYGPANQRHRTATSAGPQKLLRGQAVKLCRAQQGLLSRRSGRPWTAR